MIHYIHNIKLNGISPTPVTYTKFMKHKHLLASLFG
jgi:hypothetical protein